MAILDRAAPAVDKDDLGHWGRFAGSTSPFQRHSPSKDESADLATLASRTVRVTGRGEVHNLSFDLPANVALEIRVDGQRVRYTPGAEVVTQRFERGVSPYRFETSLEFVITNNDAATRSYRLHVAGA